MKSIGERLKELRGNRTQKQVCSQLGILQSSYAMYETDRRIPRDEVKKKIADYYSTTVEAIFF